MDMPTMRAIKVYLALRYVLPHKDRLFCLTEASGRFHLAVAAAKLSDGLIAA